MKYRDENGNWQELYLPPTGDTLPIGSIVEYDGEEVPYGYEEIGTSTSGYKLIKKIQQAVGITGTVVNTLDVTGENYVPNVDAVNERFNYTTEENVIGTFLGKPLYRKTINIGSLPSTVGTDVMYNSGLSNAICRRIYGIASNGTLNFPLPFATVNYITVYFNQSTQKIGVYCYGSPRSEYIGIVTIEYTKSTD